MRGPEKQFNRDEVLEKAVDLFWNQGYTATGMNQLLKQMGIGRQSLYDTFGDKKSLYLEALERYFHRLSGRWMAVLEKPGSPLGNLKELFRAMVRLSEESGFSGCFIGNSLAEFGHSDPDVRRILAKSVEKMEAGLTQLMRRAKEAGELSPRACPEDLARMLIVTTQGAALLSKVQPDRKRTESVLKTAFAMLEAS